MSIKLLICIIFSSRHACINLHIEHQIIFEQRMNISIKFMISVHCNFRIFFVCNKHWSHYIIWRKCTPFSTCYRNYEYYSSTEWYHTIELCSSEIWVSVSFGSLFWFHPWGIVPLVWPQLSLCCISTLFPLAILLRDTTLHCLCLPQRLWCAQILTC